MTRKIRVRLTNVHPTYRMSRIKQNELLQHTNHGILPRKRKVRNTKIAPLSRKRRLKPEVISFPAKLTAAEVRKYTFTCVRIYGQATVNYSSDTRYAFWTDSFHRQLKVRLIRLAGFVSGIRRTNLYCSFVFNERGTWRSLHSFLTVLWSHEKSVTTLNVTNVAADKKNKLIFFL